MEGGEHRDGGHKNALPTGAGVVTAAPCDGRGHGDAGHKNALPTKKCSRRSGHGRAGYRDAGHRNALPTEKCSRRSGHGVPGIGMACLQEQAYSPNPRAAGHGHYRA
jgi:hypothetical protein